MANIAGTNGNNALFGTASDDRFFASLGDDTFSGSGGYDVADYTTWGVPISVTLANHTGSAFDNIILKGSLGTDILQDIDAIYGSALDDRMEVTAPALAGNIFLYGAGGNDTIIGNRLATVFADYLSSGVLPVVADLAAGTARTASGTDTLLRVTSLRGSIGDDVLLGDDQPNRFLPMDGTNAVDGRSGFDILFGNPNDPTVVNARSGDSGTVTSVCEHGNISFTTYANIELTVTGDAADTFIGSTANDRFGPSGGSDTLEGGAGFDTVDYGFAGGLAGPAMGVVADLAAGRITDYFGGTDLVHSIEAVRGSLLSDLIAGDPGANHLAGNAGNDTLLGGAGNDTLEGGFGSDLINGGEGYDIADLRDTGRRSGSFALLGNGDVTFTQAADTDTFRNTEIIEFIDGRMVFDPTDPAAQVVRLYQAALGRGADQAGLNHWINAFDHGVPLSALAAAFLDSTEFQARYGAGTPTGNYVNLLYINALGRGADTGGHAFWTYRIDSGAITRAEALAGFSESDENTARTAALARAGIWDLSESAAIVARLYSTTFGRLPDTAGLKFWRDTLDGDILTPLGLAQAFAESQEFSYRYGANPSTPDFVEALYVNTLQRGSDLTGKTAWVGAINNGQISRAEAVLGFSESDEHVAITAPFIMPENTAAFGIAFSG